MNLVGKKVKHVKFGEGIITNKREGIVEIDFLGNNKKFHFPDAFVKFITCMDNKIQSEIDKILEGTIQKEKEKEELIKCEQERQERFRNLKVSSNSQVVFGLIENNKDKVIETWTINSGKYMSGNSKGKPRVPSRIKLNSACLITELQDNRPEEERCIIGAFMVSDDFDGKSCIDGIIRSHDRYRILLDENEEKMLFWNYFLDNGKPSKWGSVEMKYFENICMKKILEDMKEAIKDEKKKESVEEFYKYFCKVNKLAI